MDNIKIVRLQSGEDIIADYRENEGDGTVLLTNPMYLLFKRLPTGKAVMLITPWLPMELVENVSAKLYAQDILSVFQPKEKIIGHYNNTLIDIQNDMNAYEGEMSVSSDDEEGDYEEDQEELEELQDLRKYLH
jgi:hypothetical protein